jgi:hypothetical protein
MSQVSTVVQIHKDRILLEKAMSTTSSAVKSLHNLLLIPVIGALCSYG